MKALLVSIVMLFTVLGCSQQSPIIEKPKNDSALKDTPKLPAPTPGSEDLVK
jgi:hypothetical protein